MAIDSRIPLLAGQIESPLMGLSRGIQAGQERAERKQAMDLRDQQAQIQQQTFDANQADALVKGMGKIAHHVVNEIPSTTENYQQLRKDRALQLASISGVDLPPEIQDEDLSEFEDGPLRGVAQLAGLGGDRKGFTLGEGQTRFDAQGNVVASLEPKKKDDKTQSIVKDLRSRYDKFNADLRDVDAAFRKVKGAPESAAGDLSLIFNYMKMLDPGSTVREGEFATAQNAAGVDERIMNLYNNVVSGERLNPRQRKDFKATAASAFDAQQASADEQTAMLLSQADEDGVPRVRVLGKDALRAFEKRAAERLISNQKPTPETPEATPATPAGRGAAANRQKSYTSSSGIQFTVE